MPALVIMNRPLTAEQADGSDSTRGHSWSAEVALATGPGAIPHPSFDLGPKRDAHLWLLTFRPVRPWGRVGPVEVAYAPDLVQLILVAGTPRYLGSWFRSRDGLDSTYAVLPFGKHSVWGVGSAPLNLRLTSRVMRVHGLYGEVTGGVSWFLHEVPDRGAGQVQFQLIVGAGVWLSFGKRQGVMIGYRHHHLSNGGLTDDNAALNTHLFQLAVRLR
jgi:hypothetical protein